MKLESIQKEWNGGKGANMTDRTMPSVHTDLPISSLQATPQDTHSTLTINNRNERKAIQS